MTLWILFSLVFCTGSRWWEPGRRKAAGTLHIPGRWRVTANVSCYGNWRTLSNLFFLNNNLLHCVNITLSFRSRTIRRSISLRCGCYRTGDIQNTPACTVSESMENLGHSETTTNINAYIKHIAYCLSIALTNLFNTVDRKEVCMKDVKDIEATG